MLQRSYEWDQELLNKCSALMGFDKSFKFRDQQREAVNAALLGYSTFLMFPTGLGKSLCYQLPAMIFPGVHIIVSPLLSLIQDQVTRLQNLAIPVIELTSNLSKDEKRDSLKYLLSDDSKIRFVYCTPESLSQDKVFQDAIDLLILRKSLSRLVIDEAHCILEWGNTFRPSYLALGVLRKNRYPDIPVTLVTATITNVMRKEILNLFGLLSLDDFDKEVDLRDRSHHCISLINHSDKSNLSLNVRYKDEKTLFDIAKTISSKPSLVYCLTKLEAENLAKDLQKYGCVAKAYHGGMSSTERKTIQNMWLSNKISTIVATVAFGMGIDRPDVRYVIHHSMPMSLFSYYQQIGRAGRDYEKADCILYYSPKDKYRAVVVGENSVTGGSRQVIEDAQDMSEFCESLNCRRKILLKCIDTNFDSKTCSRNCNCGEIDFKNLLLNSSEKEITKKNDIKKIKRNKVQEIDYNKVIKYDYSVCFLYESIKTLAKRNAAKHKKKFSQREILSKRVLQDVLSIQPDTIEDFAAMKGVGLDKANRFYHLVQEVYKRKE